MSLEALRLQIADFLATPLIVNKLIEIDIWSFVHFIIGMLLVLAIFKYSFLKKYRKNPMRFVFPIIIASEILEIIVWSNPATFNNFIPEPESFINQVWDIIISFSGVIFQIRRTK